MILFFLWQSARRHRRAVVRRRLPEDGLFPGLYLFRMMQIVIPEGVIANPDSKIMDPR